MRNVCKISEALWRLTKTGVEWRWTEVEQKAFDDLKAAISCKPMAYFNPDWTTELVVDASSSGLGAILTQQDPNNPENCHEIAYASRLLSDVERRYSQCEKEGLAAVWGCERFRVYLMGKPF